MELGGQRAAARCFPRTPLSQPITLESAGKPSARPIVRRSGPVWCCPSRSCCRQQGLSSPAQISRLPRPPRRSPHLACNGHRRRPPRPSSTRSSVARTLIDARPVWLRRSQWRPLATALKPGRRSPLAGQPWRTPCLRLARSRTDHRCSSSRRRTSGGSETSCPKDARPRLSSHLTGRRRRVLSLGATRASPPRPPNTPRRALHHRPQRRATELAVTVLLITRRQISGIHGSHQ